MWNSFTNSLLEKNHIKIPIEKRFFLSFIEDDENNIQKKKIIKKLHDNGFYEDDPRLSQFFNNLKIFIKGDNIQYEEFKYCVENHIYILQKILRNECIVPQFNKFTKEIEIIYEKTISCKGGNNADYIPQLSRINPEQYGISVCTIDGQRYNIGDTEIDFTVQSCCKPINYGIALENLGEEYVHKYVGREPSGQAFNELLLNKKGNPHNPLINSGAIMTTSMLFPEEELSSRFEKLIDVWHKLSGGLYKIGFNNSVYLSEKKTADRNYALSYFMQEINENKPVGFPENTDLNETLELYFQSCSIEVNTRILSIVAASLANGGTNPFTGVQIFSPETVKNILSVMLTCGMYDYSGEFAFKIGIPAKSGVAGAIMIVVPNVMGIAIWSPRLDKIGNSERGIQFCKEFGKKFNFHIFDSLNNQTKINPLSEKYNDDNTHIFYELCMCAKEGDLEHLKILFNRGIDFNQSDYDGRTALHIAVCENNEEIIKFLINTAKVNINKKDRWNKTPKDECNEKYLSYFN